MKETLTGDLIEATLNQTALCPHWYVGTWQHHTCGLPRCCLDLPCPPRVRMGTLGLVYRAPELASAVTRAGGVGVGEGLFSGGKGAGGGAAGRSPGPAEVTLALPGLLFPQHP